MFSQVNSMKISIRVLVVCGGLSGGVFYASAGVDLIGASSSATNKTTQDMDTNGVLSVEGMLRNVLEDNPSLKAARANWEAMKQRVPQARAWEDLRAGFDGVAGRFVN